MKISDIGEFGLIDIIKKMGATSKGISGIGDDCAIIPMDSQKEIVVTVDTLVKDVHFLGDADPYLLGRKSLAVNISDVAAMAATPKWAFLSLSLRSDTEMDYIESFMKGLYSMADEFGVELLGGDTTGGSNLVITITLIGENPINKSIKRSGANIGDDVYVTGEIGCSYTGLIAIKKKLEGFAKAKKKHLEPTPRVKEALAVREFASAMIDISDGLLQDCLHICEESSVGIEIDLNEVPLCKERLVSETDMISGGEDYELIFTANKKYEKVLKNIENIKKVGRVTDGNSIKVIENGRELHIKHLGFKHF